MLDNLSIATPDIDRPYILNSGTLNLIEDLYRTEYTLDRSRIKATFESVEISGLIDRLYYEIYDGDIHADNVIEFTAVPSGLEEIEIAGTTYKFVATLSGLNDVPIKNTSLGNAVSLYRVLNTDGVPGTDFHADQTANTIVSGLLADNPLYLQVIASGVIGNTYAIYKEVDSESILVYNIRFTKGKTQNTKDPLLYGYVQISGNINTDYYLPDLPSSDYGVKYYVTLYFATSSGYQALDVGHNPSFYHAYTPRFIGRTSLPYYAEVSGLVGVDLVIGKIPSIGELTLSWENMLLHSGANVHLAHPLGSGILSQSTGYYDMEVMGQKLHYIVFVFQSSAGNSPECSWPRPLDANGTWYFAGRTYKTNALLYVPVGTTYSVWVGFGNADTLRTSGLPIDIVHPNIYVED